MRPLFTRHFSHHIHLYGKATMPPPLLRSQRQPVENQAQRGKHGTSPWILERSHLSAFVSNYRPQILVLVQGDGPLISRTPPVEQWQKRRRRELSSILVYHGGLAGDTEQVEGIVQGFTEPNQAAYNPFRHLGKILGSAIWLGISVSSLSAVRSRSRSG